MSIEQNKFCIVFDIIYQAIKPINIGEIVGKVVFNFHIYLMFFLFIQMAVNFMMFTNKESHSSYVLMGCIIQL